ncbi:MAG TPA: hypothetical protein VGI19_05260, partial [Candidatus Cybelea sp.]
MSFSNYRAFVALAIASIAMTACGGGVTSIPASQSLLNNAQQPLDSGGAMPADSTSILKKLTKDVTIGSTVDPGNGDTGPRAIAVVPSKFGKLLKNQILVCNYDDKAGDVGKGTTLEVLSPAAGSKPKTFVQSSKIEGCAGDAVTSGDQIYVGAATAKKLVWVNQSGVIKKAYGPPITAPFADQEAPPLYLYSPVDVWVGNANSGGVDTLSLGSYGTGQAKEVINGFPVNKGSGWSALGPSGFAYWCKALPGQLQCKAHSGTADTLFVADGDCNAVVSIDHASSLLVKDEITVQKNCTSFKCKYPSTSCGKLIASGSPLNKPFAAAILPNGNLVVANTGDNSLVEMMPSGKVLATKTVDTGNAPAIFGLFAIGTSDSNTAIYYTDTNSNELHE